jgi:hypothetical protein
MDRPSPHPGQKERPMLAKGHRVKCGAEPGLRNMSSINPPHHASASNGIREIERSKEIFISPEDCEKI